MARVEWSEAELNATAGELSGGNSAVQGNQADEPPLGTKPESRVIQTPAAILSCPHYQGSDLLGSGHRRHEAPRPHTGNHTYAY